MKKFLAIILALTLALTFVACSSNAPTEAPAEGENGEAETPPEEGLD